ncbi:hypothetical protein [Geodermatophilus sp. CPCC 206100]|uniref:hypothetical protein n=1 Tax=Geodermatophilus sp. CPCC 206100 TaxID=3020054 RepID=UPI003AFF8FFF
MLTEAVDREGPNHPAPLEVRPQAPLFTASVDQRTGAIRTRGHLDLVGAELLRSSVVALRRCGHRSITVHVQPPATADAPARALLADLADRLAAEGVLLEVR